MSELKRLPTVASCMRNSTRKLSAADNRGLNFFELLLVDVESSIVAWKEMAKVFGIDTPVHAEYDKLFRLAGSLPALIELAAEPLPDDNT